MSIGMTGVAVAGAFWGPVGWGALAGGVQDRQKVNRCRAGIPEND